MERKCVPLESGYCSNLPYNITTYPNMLGHKTIEEVDMVIDVIKEVVDSGCHPLAYEMLCMTVQPVCYNDKVHVSLFPHVVINTCHVSRSCLRAPPSAPSFWPRVTATSPGASWTLSAVTSCPLRRTAPEPVSPNQVRPVTRCHELMVTMFRMCPGSEVTGSGGQGV